MGTPSDAPDPDFWVSLQKETTDSREEESPIERKKKEPRGTPQAEKEPDGPERITEPRGGVPNRSQDLKPCTPCHDPGGSWLTKKLIGPVWDAAVDPAQTALMNGTLLEDSIYQDGANDSVSEKDTVLRQLM
ncbi:hypothetical protein NDU88_005623 [Pleurodeles waltl]|uniref:Uncharacterized protein n=1 Tax=Pleurodeles waltl TaxID=8319 RepID=A0AAV7MB32_PLEWA|nr:hypothetical protein NDU88_005623 [Pleurodeles waltl]